jgi:hypothetical protein
MEVASVETGDPWLNNFLDRSASECDDRRAEAIASIITRPNGSSHSMGKTRAAARLRKARF